MTSGESFENSAVQVDGVQFETLMPERVFSIPVDISNNSQTFFPLGFLSEARFELRTRN